MKYIKFVYLLLTLLFVNTLQAADITGKIKDKTTNEPLISATIVVVGTKKGAYSGLDGSYKLKNLSDGKYTIRASYVGYQEITKTISIKDDIDVKLDFVLEPKNIEGRDIMVYASKDLSSEQSSRQSEQFNVTTSNIVSSKVIEASPDITVSTIIQKMSGVSIEEEGSNEGAYAIIRGMDKRYNNTLVNGIKIPSPDAKNRFVPLDIFPADVIERLEVFKSVTPDMEADAIGGTVNLVMKNAPDRQLVKANAAIGYNDLFLDRDFLSFNSGVQNSRSPGRITEWKDNASKEEKQAVIEKYFPLEASVFSNQTAAPNAILGLTIGDRFGEFKELGAVLALSYQGITRGQNQVSTNIDPDRTSGLTTLDNVYVRENSISEQRLAIHNKFDYTFDKDNKLSLYNAFMMLDQQEAWYLMDSSYFRLAFVRTVNYELYNQQINQNIYNSTLKGDHNLSDNLMFDWSAAYSFASRNQPDRANLRLNRQNVDNIHGYVRTDYDYRYTRSWVYNSDQDFALYTNLKHFTYFDDLKIENKFGSLVRYKTRNTTQDDYELRPFLNNSNNDYPGNQEYVYKEDVRNGDIRNTYFRLFNPNGTPGDANNFDIFETVIAGYYQAKITTDFLEITAGARAEYTNLGFQTGSYNPNNSTTFSKNDVDYLNILPGIFFKYKPQKDINVRLSYNQALARPSFYEFVPAIEINSDGELMRGNPGLRNSTSDNFDARFEYFPSALDKIFVGVFYKAVKDPIERSYSGDGLFSFENFESATNYGLELEYTQYFGQLGVRMNYSYTSSEMTSQKLFYFRLTEENQYLIDEDVSGRLRQDIEAGTVKIGDLTNIIRNEARPMQGQTDHIFNFSVLYKNQNIDFDAQLDFNYTGERIAFVAREYQLDWWQRPQINLDFSMEQKVGDFTIYFKSRNLLDTPREFYVKRPLVDLGVRMPWQEYINDPNNPDANITRETFARQNLFGRNVQIGFRYLFN